MLPIPFKFDRKQKMYIDEKYISNGHWLVTRNFLYSPQCPKSLSSLLSLQIGVYDSGIAHPKYDNEKMPEWAQIIPKRDGYQIITPVPVSSEFRESSLIPTLWALVYEFPGGEIGVDPAYGQLAQSGAAFAKDPKAPIIVLDSGDLNGELLAIVMPMRLEVVRKRRANPIEVAAANLIEEWNTAETQSGINWDTFTPLIDALKTAVEK